MNYTPIVDFWAEKCLPTCVHTHTETSLKAWPPWSLVIKYVLHDFAGKLDPDLVLRKFARTILTSLLTDSSDCFSQAPTSAEYLTLFYTPWLLAPRTMLPAGPRPATQGDRSKLGSRTYPRQFRCIGSNIQRQSPDVRCRRTARTVFHLHERSISFSVGNDKWKCRLRS